MSPRKSGVRHSTMMSGLRRGNKHDHMPHTWDLCGSALHISLERHMVAERSWWSTTQSLAYAKQHSWHLRTMWL